MTITNPIETIYNLVKLFISRNLGINLLGDRVEDIFNFLKISDLIATAGQPTKQQLSVVKSAGYQIVINLAPSKAMNASLPDEQGIVESLGMEYVHIPVIADNPTLEDFARFSQVMQANATKPVFVHCAGNFRVSAFMYLYRRIYQQLNEEKARKDLHQIWIPSDTWQHFMQQAIKSRNKFISPDLG